MIAPTPKFDVVSILKCPETLTLIAFYCTRNLDKAHRQPQNGDEPGDRLLTARGILS